MPTEEEIEKYSDTEKHKENHAEYKESRIHVGNLGGELCVAVMTLSR